jgi:hypothetical protein
MTARSLMTRLALALGLSGALHGQAMAAGSVSVEQAPTAWLAYAKDATASVTAWLNGDAPPAPRMRDALMQLHPNTDQPPPTLVLSLWVSPTGAISKVEAKPTGDAPADADLRALLLGRQLPAPPKGMLLPMRLGIQINASKLQEKKT